MTDDIRKTAEKLRADFPFGLLVEQWESIIRDERAKGLEQAATEADRWPRTGVGRYLRALAREVREGKP